MTLEFAKAMRSRDASLKLIGWGDSGWAGDLVERAGEYNDYVAVHMMGQTPLRKDTVLHGCKYQSDPERAWSELMEMIGARIEQCFELCPNYGVIGARDIRRTRRILILRLNPGFGPKHFPNPAVLAAEE